MPTLRVFENGRDAREHLLGDLTLIGRQVAVDVLVPDRRVALQHAVIERRGIIYVLKDLGSAHGTLVGGAAVHEHVLRDGDPIVFGRVRCEFNAAPQASADEYTRVAPRASLTVQDLDAVPRTLELREGIVGAFSHAVLRIRGGSPRHARIVLFAGVFYVESIDGPVVLDGLLVARAALTDGASLEMGMLRATLRFADPPTTQAITMPTLQIDQRSHLALVVAPDAAGRHSVALGEEAVIGRAPDSKIQLTDPCVSRRHCRIFLQHGAYYVEDLGSKLGTMVDERLIRGAHLLADGSMISVGQSSMAFCADPPSLVFG